MPVRSEHGAAAAGVGDNGLAAIAKGIYVLSRQDPRAVKFAGMRVQSATANLANRRLRRASVCFQNSRRGGVDSLKQTLGHTRLEQQRRSARWSARILRAERGHPARIGLVPTRPIRRSLQQSQPKLKFRRHLSRKSYVQ